MNNALVTKVVAMDVDSGTTLAYSTTGGSDANLFKIDSSTGVLAFKSLPAQPKNLYAVEVQASDGSTTNGTDKQLLTIKIAADKMDGDIAHTASDTLVFHAKGANEVTNFDLAHDFLQFDKGMFAQDTAAAVLAAAEDDKKGNLIITNLSHDRFQIDGVSKADLARHTNDIVFL